MTYGNTCYTTQLQSQVNSAWCLCTAYGFQFQFQIGNNYFLYYFSKSIHVFVKQARKEKKTLASAEHEADLSRPRIFSAANNVEVVSHTVLSLTSDGWKSISIDGLKPTVEEYNNKIPYADYDHTCSSLSEDDESERVTNETYIDDD